MSNFVFNNQGTREIESRWIYFKGTLKEVFKECRVPNPEGMTVYDAGPRTLIRFGKGSRGEGYLRVPYLVSTGQVSLKGQK